MGEKDFVEAFLKEELRLVNKHAPKSRISLCDLLRMEVAYVATSNGGLHVFDPDELKYLAEITNRDCSLKLPIILEYVPEGEGFYVVEDPVGASVIARLLKLSDYSKPLILYKSQVLELRKILKTTTVILLNPRALKIE
ncbi:MAG: DUF61 family protein [Candidatus Nezhaarchaeales archaeon]